MSSGQLLSHRPGTPLGDHCCSLCLAPRTSSEAEWRHVARQGLHRTPLCQPQRGHGNTWLSQEVKGSNWSFPEPHSWAWGPGPNTSEFKTDRQPSASPIRLPCTSLGWGEESGRQEPSQAGKSPATATDSLAGPSWLPRGCCSWAFEQGSTTISWLLVVVT